MRRALAAAAFVCLVSAAAGKWLPAGGASDREDSLDALIECRMGGGRLTLMRYDDYGCWCGEGHRPLADRYPDFSMDEIDQACQRHELCYGEHGLRENGTCDPDRLLMAAGTMGFDGYQIDCAGGRVADFRSGHEKGSRADVCARSQYKCDIEMVNKIAARPIPPLVGKPKCPVCIYRTSWTTHYTMVPGKQYLIGNRCFQCDENGETTDCTACCDCYGRCYDAGFQDDATVGCTMKTGGHSCYTCYPNGKWSPGCNGLCRFCRMGSG